MLYTAHRVIGKLLPLPERRPEHIISDVVTAQLFTRTSSTPQSSTWSAVAARWSAVACAALAIGVLSTFGEGRRLSTSGLGAQLSSRPAFPSSRREPLSSPRDSKASNMRPLRDYDSFASWTVARRITSRSRSLPTDRIAIGFMSKVDRHRVFHGFASLAEVFAEYLVSRLPHANRFG